jgi:DNA-binding NarL/FixJ family response regulator
LHRVEIALIAYGLPRMLQEIIKEILATRSDLGLIAEYPHRVPLVAAVEETSARLVIAADEQLDPDEVCQVLERRPRTKILGVAGDARAAVLYELRPQKIRLGEVSPETLVAAIRAAAAECTGHMR